MSLPEFWHTYEYLDRPFLTEQRHQWQREQPLQGIRVLHNTPLTVETLMKVDCLVQAGADVTLTRTQFIRPAESDALHQAIKEMGVRYIPEHDDLIPFQDSFDFVLDCCAQLINIIRPKKGIVELTGSGTFILQENSKQLLVPAMSIDDSQLKQLECFYGTADGFIRGFQQESTVSLDNQTILVFGYGKVGKGIVHGLQSFDSKIMIVDACPIALTTARESGLTAIAAHDTKAILQALDQATIVVTAIGIHAALNHIPASAFQGKVLVNMGGEDDFGPHIAANLVLGEKQPINFLLQSPTLMKYLDPSFYAHNHAIELLLTGQFAPGYHPYPKSADDAVMQQWHEFDKSREQPA